MNNTKFTKGEWKVVDATKIGEQLLFVHVEGAGVVCRLTKVADTNIPLSKGDIANAHLIAAAPEMYRVLSEVSELADGDMGFATDWLLNNTDDLISLLAKARGER
jgi:hypothetical protein